MKRITSFISVLLVFSLLFVSNSMFSYADNVKNYYYIDSIDGDDSADGLTPETAVKTIAGLKNLSIGAGTHFLFRNGGEYECEVTLTCEGTKDNPVVISSYGDGEKALLYTDEKKEIFQLIDCSYVTVSDLHLKAVNGGGIWIDTLNKTSYGIILENLLFTDMQN